MAYDLYNFLLEVFCVNLCCCPRLAEQKCTECFCGCSVVYLPCVSASISLMTQ